MWGMKGKFWLLYQTVDAKKRGTIFSPDLFITLRRHASSDRPVNSQQDGSTIPDGDCTIWQSSNQPQIMGSVDWHSGRLPVCANVSISEEIPLVCHPSSRIPIYLLPIRVGNVSTRIHQVVTSSSLITTFQGNLPSCVFGRLAHTRFYHCPSTEKENKVQNIDDHWRWTPSISALDMHRIIGTIQYMAQWVLRSKLHFCPVQGGRSRYGAKLQRTSPSVSRLQDGYYANWPGGLPQQFAEVCCWQHLKSI